MFRRDSKNKKDLKGFKGNIFVRTWFWFKSLSFIKHIFFFYLFITIIGSLLLWWDYSQKANAGVSYTNALFTAASAFSDTGLSPLTAGTTFSMFGQAVIAILILVGGIGWFALKVYFFNIMFGKPMSFATRDALAAERGSANVGVTRDLIKIAVTILFTIIVIAALALTLYFYFTPVAEADRYTSLHNGQLISNFGDNTALDAKWSSTNILQDNSDLLKQQSFIPTGNWDLSIKYGIFHAISAINNAGFDIIGGQSIAGYYHAYGLQIIFIILFVLGGVGYPVIYDTWKKLSGVFTGKKHKYSLFSKISMTAYAAITLIGLALVFGIECTAKDDVRISGALNQNIGKAETYHAFWNDDKYGNHGTKTMALFFNTMSTRNAGFSTINMGTLSHGTMITYIILMFIGSAPSSTAGGIRTTTMAVIVLGLWSRVRGKKTVKVFNRRLPTETVKNSYIVFSTAFIICVIAVLVSMTSLSTHGGALNAVSQAPGQPAGISQIKNNAITGERFNFTEIMFEVGSAFGTTGLSAGVTSGLSLASKLVLILVMFIGQLGVSSSILVWARKNPKSRHYGYVKEDISIG